MEKEILEKSRLEEALKSMNVQGEKSREDRSNMEDRRDMRNRIKSLQQQMHVAEKENIEREKDRLQRDLDETNRRHEQILEEKNKEAREQAKRMKIEYESKMNSENLRKRERDNIENENVGALEDIVEGIKRLFSGTMKGWSAYLELLGE